MYLLGELARRVGGEVRGSARLTIRGVAPLDEAGPHEITLAVDARRLEQARASRAGAVIVPKDAPDIGRPVLVADNPRLAFAQVLELFAPEPSLPVGIHPSAVVGEGVRLGRGVRLGARVVVGDRAQLGPGVVLHPGVYVGPGARLGEGTVVHANAVIREGVQVGKGCIIHAGAVIGSDGFGYVQEGGRHRKVPHIGTVILEDEVEVGACSAVDRATCGATRIGRGTKIDNLVQVGHNVVLGENCLVVALTGIGGSVRLGRGVTLAGQVGVTDHSTVGDEAVVAARGLVQGSVEPGAFVSGFPARPHAENMRTLAATRRLPELLQTVRSLQRRLEALETALGGSGATAGNRGMG